VPRTGHCTVGFLLLTGYYFWILKGATWNHVQILDYNVKVRGALITEVRQQIYSGILILFKLLTLVIILRLSTCGIKLVLQIDVHASCN
jgi:hypothetical protein